MKSQRCCPYIAAGRSPLINFESITTLTNYIRTNEMTQKWTMKKKSGDMTADGTMSVSEAWRQKKNAEDRKLMEGIVPDLNKQKENDRMNAIRTKMGSGQELTEEELKLLKEKDPYAYQAEMERRQSLKAYKQKLANARTKEEFQRIRMSQAASHLARLNSVKNDPVIPDEAKLAVYTDITARVKAERNIEQKFAESGAYDRLPTEREKAEAEKAAEEKLSGEAEIRRIKSESQDSSEKTDALKEHGQTEKKSVSEEKDSDQEKDSGSSRKDPISGSDAVFRKNDSASENDAVLGMIESESENQQIVGMKQHRDQDEALQDRLDLYHLKESADKSYAEVDQKSDYELDEIRRKVNRAKLQKNRFLQSDQDASVMSRVSFQA